MDTSMSSKLSDDQKDRIYKRTALQSPTKMESVAETAVFLLSDKSGSITGQNVFVDSGTI
jgi:3-oxoacyl-[acyl-carrier protein] reductase